jgi:hypothetical protein
MRNELPRIGHDEASVAAPRCANGTGLLLRRSPSPTRGPLTGRDKPGREGDRHRTHRTHSGQLKISNPPVDRLRASAFVEKERR